MNRTTIIGLTGMAILVSALGLNFWLNQESVEEIPETQPAVNSNSSESQNLPSEIGPDISLSGMSAVVLPEFDVVRIAENGDTVIAGRGLPKSEITILDGTSEVGTVVVDTNGEWVFLPTEPLPPGSRELSLKAVNPDGNILFSENVVILVVPETGLDIAGRTSETSSQPLALLVPREGTEGPSRVLQKPSVPGSVETKNGELSLDSVEYGDAGRLSLRGRGLPDLDIQVYLDNRLIGNAKVQPNGLWHLKPQKPVEPGVYSLRIDETKNEKVIARLEVPFSRAEPLKDFASTAFIVVQPGNSLWRIARKTLGAGIRYTVLYEANKEQIRNPDLIFPGQIFEVPTD